MKAPFFNCGDMSEAVYREGHMRPKALGAQHLYDAHGLDVLGDGRPEKVLKERQDNGPRQHGWLYLQFTARASEPPGAALGSPPNRKLVLPSSLGGKIKTLRILLRLSLTH